MNENLSLDANCILLISGSSLTTRATACKLAVNGAIVFIAANSDLSLKGDLEYIRSVVPESSVTGVVSDTASAAGMSDFLLSAEIALPKHDALINFLTTSDESTPEQSVFEGGRRLFAKMANHRKSRIINISESSATSDKLANLDNLMRENLKGLGIMISSINMQGFDETTESVDKYAVEGAKADAIANTVLYILCQPNHYEVTDICLRSSI